MNTPDTEWEKEFDENYNQVTLWNGLGYGNVHTELKSFIIRTCIAEWNKGFEKGRSEYLDKAKDIDEAITSRDTYWKERVEEIIKMADALELECGKDGDKGTKQWMAFKGFRNTIRDRFLTNEDNLK